MIDKFNLIFVTFLNTGRIGFAPGTFASFFTCIVFLFLNNFIDVKIIFILTLIIFLYSIFAINKVIKHFNSDDPKEIVIDEFVGQMLTLLAIPVYQNFYPTFDVYYCVFAFFLFRSFVPVIALQGSDKCESKPNHRDVIDLLEQKSKANSGKRIFNRKRH